jgi:hypothetical protein
MSSVKLSGTKKPPRIMQDKDGFDIPQESKSGLASETTKISNKLILFAINNETKSKISS